MTPCDTAGVASNSTDLQGLYRPEEFRDNCGFGLIAHIQGEPSHRLLETAIESLTCRASTALRNSGITVALA